MTDEYDASKDSIGSYYAAIEAKRMRGDHLPYKRKEVAGDCALYLGDCRDVLRSLPDNSIDAVVTDPPYALVSIQKRFGKPGSKPAKDVYARGAAGFMGKQWDTGEVAFNEEFWAEVYRVLKPGGHVVSFGGTRTYHRMAVAIEDAGFEIRDRIRFDQSFDTKFGPLMDSLNDEQRRMLLELLNDYVDGGSELAWTYGSGFPKSHNQKGNWQGWGTALKPAWEPICLARKPLDGTVAANLAKWGVGALNIDGCRIGTETITQHGRSNSENTSMAGRNYAEPAGREWQGRWPANIVHDGSDEVLAAFPDAKGQQGYVGPKHGERPSRGIYGDFGARPDSHPRVESETSAARFFYCAKTSRKDRDEGLEHLPEVTVSGGGGTNSEKSDAYGAVKANRRNVHPTVKPTDLMRWLCRLVTPPGGVILDPFMGSGSTGKAALLEGFGFVGIEREEEYFEISNSRIEAAKKSRQGNEE